MRDDLYANKHDLQGRTPLHIAAMCKNVNVARNLLNFHGVKVNEMDMFDATPLDYCYEKLSEDHSGQVGIKSDLEKRNLRRKTKEIINLLKESGGERGMLMKIKKIFPQEMIDLIQKEDKFQDHITVFDM